MGMRCNMWLIDADGKAVDGGSKIAGRYGSIDVWNMEHAIALPYDSNTGKPTARRKHDPIGILKTIDSSSPVLSKACCTGSSFKRVHISLYEINEYGREYEYFRYILDNAKVVAVRPLIATSDSAAPHLEHISMSYQTIHWQYLDGHIEAQDNWLIRS